MKPRQVDLVVIGASFAGLVCARTAALRGLSVVVIEAKREPGARIHTTDILVKEAAEEIDTPPRFSRAIHGVRLYAPSLKSIDLRAPGYYFGEPYFREGERRVIARLLAGGSQVLATGGGAFINEETRRRIGESGVSVWLKADLPLLMKRVMKRADRPLLRTEDPEAVMRKLMADRYPVYAGADVTVDSRDVQHGQMVNEVIKALARWNGWHRFSRRSEA